MHVPDPFQTQVFDVFCIDLIQWAVTMSVEIPSVHWPISRVRVA